MPATLLLSSHSELEPPLPIPNRAVKRLSADDSADYPCESRTSSGTQKRKAPAHRVGAFVFLVAVDRLTGPPTAPRQRSATRCPSRPNPRPQLEAGL